MLHRLLLLFRFQRNFLSRLHCLTIAFSYETQGPHLLAPTGSDLRRYGKEGTVFAGYHYDLNFLTIHGRSRFPGLNIWLRNGQKMEVKVPIGCLLIQTGKQVRSYSTSLYVLCSELVKQPMCWFLLEVDLKDLEFGSKACRNLTWK